MFRLLLSIVIGWVLGQERKRHDKSGGGSRTLAIVSLASCLIAILTLQISIVINPETFNFSRMMAYCIVGISFLCSAVIHPTKNTLEGTTTASLIWGCVPISFAIGLGFYFYGIISAVLVYLILESKYWKLS
ncbi:MAG: MgtC/SapB family protein [Candidatus Helarchaeota archaeon]